MATMMAANQGMVMMVMAITVMPRVARNAYMPSTMPGMFIMSIMINMRRNSGMPSASAMMMVLLLVLVA